MNTSKSNGYKLSFCGLLTLIFIVLKLTHAINWSWLWVLSPLWMPYVVGAAIVAIVAVVTIKLS